GQVPVTTPPGTQLTDNGSVSSENLDTVSGNNTASRTATVQASADLIAAILDVPGTAVAGTRFTFRLNVGNAGPNDAKNVVLDALLSSALKFVSLTSASCQTPAGASGAIHCTFATLPARDVFTVSVVVDVPPTERSRTTTAVNANTFSDTLD